MKYVLDTNIAAPLLDGDERVLSQLADVESTDVGIPLLVLAELLFGAEKSTRGEQKVLDFGISKFNSEAMLATHIPVGVPATETACTKKRSAAPLAVSL